MRVHEKLQRCSRPRRKKSLKRVHKQNCEDYWAEIGRVWELSSGRSASSIEEECLVIKLGVQAFPVYRLEKLFIFRLNTIH